MSGRARKRKGDRRSAADRRGSVGVPEMLEPRGMLSGIGVPLMPPPPAGGSVVAPPTAAVAALRLTIPPSAPNGSPVAAVISAVDASGRPVFASSAVALSSSDPAATLPATVQLVRGRAVVPVTFRTAGGQTLTATDAADATRTATASTTVGSPLVATRLVVMMPPQVLAGDPVTVTALAVNAAGRPVPTFSGSATVTSSDAAISVPLIEVLFRDGRASFSVSFATVGRQTLTLTALEDSSVSGSGVTTVAARQAPASFLMMVPPRAVAGSPVNVGIVALDAARRPLIGYTGVATLSSSDAGATLPATVTFRAGRASAMVTFASPGEQMLSVRGGPAGDILGAATVRVVAAPLATRFAVVLPKAVPVGVPVLVTLVALDAQGKPVANVNGSATLSSSDPAARFPASVRLVNGRGVVRMVFGTLGEQTLTATSDAITGGSITGTGTTRVDAVLPSPVSPIARASVPASATG